MTDSCDFRDTLYASYVRTHQGKVPETRSQPSLEAHVLTRLPADKRAAILDVGCGQGQLVRLLNSRGYQAVAGIDTSGEQIALAHSLGTSSVEKADVFEYAASHRGHFDALLAIDLVEHFDRSEVPLLFKTLADLLTPGGTLVLRTPNASSPYSGRLLYGDLTHGIAYTRRSLEQVCASSGFTSVEVYPVRPAGSAPRQLSRRAIWSVIERMLVLPLIVETGQVRGHIVTQNLSAKATKERNA